MKKEFMASVLTLTAGMASTVSFPNYALARSTGKIEKQYPKKFQLKSNLPARYTDDNGRVVQGHIYLKLDQTPFTPASQNQLEGEMSGYFYFESDEAINETRQGDKYKTFVSIVGDDGESLLDLVNKSTENGRTYQIYGCNSSLTSCNHEEFNITFGGTEHSSPILLNYYLPQDSRIEIYTPKQRWPTENGKVETYYEWDKEGAIDMIQTTYEE
ncbi:MAG: hypothetical protein ACXVCP_14210 [Bdellovibrio sp.]